MPHITKDSKPRIRAELEKIRKSDPNRVLRPEAVVDFAQANKRSALHQEFNWDLKEAARQHWLNQARGIIRIHVTMIEVTNGKTENIAVAEYISLPDHRKMGYERVAEVLDDEDRRLAMLRYTIERLLSIKEVGVFKELHEVAVAINEAADQYLPSRKDGRKGLDPDLGVPA